MADGNVDTGCSTPTVKTKTCRFFQTKKGCKFGDDCRFLHLEKLSNESGSVLHEAGNEDQKKNLKLHNEDKEPFKAERNEMEERKDASSDRQGIVCKFFQRKRGCLRGDKCPFAHVIRDGESTLHKSACDKNPGNASERPKKQTTHQRKEIPKPESDKKQTANQLTETANVHVLCCDKQPTEHGDPHLQVQEDNGTKSTMSGQGSGVTLSTSSDTTKHAGTGKEAAHHKHKGVGTGADGKGVSLPNKYNSTNRVKCGKGTPLSKTNNVSKGAETVTGIPLAKKNKAIRGTESATGIPILKEGITIKGSETRLGDPVLYNDNEIKHEESEKHLPLSQKKNVTHGAVTRQRVPLPNKENVRKHAETGHRVPLHDKDNATNFRGTFTLGDAILSEPKRLRSTEIQQLKRRFGGKGGFSEIKENSSYKIKFKPTDPDWPFKIEAVYLTVCFPDDYPLHIFNVALSEEQDLSQDIINFVTQRIQQWTTLQQEQMGKSQGTLKLYFRPFLRWFDNNLVSLFIDGGEQMRARYVSSISGIDDTACRIPSDSPAPESQDSVISSTPDQEYLQDTSCDGRGSNTGIDWEPMKPTQINKISDGSHLIIKEDSKGLDILCNDAVLSQELHSDTLKASTSVCTPDSASGHDANNKTINIDPSCDDNVLDKVPLKQIMETDSRNSNNCKQSFASEHAAQLSQSDVYASGATAERGTQIQFKGLNLEESTSSMRGHKLVITLECNRCRQRIDQQLSASGSIVKQCTRCAAAFAVTYRPAVIHQFSSVLGYLDIDGCVAFDVILPESELMLGCFQCSKETSVKGLQYGANWSWCGHCHQKLRFQIQSTRFQQLQSSASNTAVPLRKNTVSGSSAKTKKQPPSSGMKEGQPLPANGTCKHYKKSYRWLRFPCCGKCYPCDLCHEEEEDHEMKYASRMVCGFCSREQPYSQQPCSGCKASVTKSRSAHWEGGKGCRDKVSMSRNDDQKFRQLGKTTSRKAQKHSEGKGKGHKGN